jgi:beta-glucosidase-like glycosyl hydrolase
LGFKGFVMSDWGANYQSPNVSIAEGLDQEMGHVGG